MGDYIEDGPDSFLYSPSYFCHAERLSIALVQLRPERTVMQELPQVGYLRLSQIIGDPKRNPPLPPIIPVGKSTWWQGVRDGRFPKPVKIGPKTTAWRVADIRALVDVLGG